MRVRVGLLVGVQLVLLTACGSTVDPPVTSAPSTVPTATATGSSGHLSGSLLVLQDMPRGYEQGPVPTSRSFCGRKADPAPIERAEAFFAGPGTDGTVGVRTRLSRFATPADARREFESLRSWIAGTCHRDDLPTATNLISIDPGPRLGDDCYVVTEVLTLKGSDRAAGDTEIGTIDFILKGQLIVQVGVLAPRQKPDLLDKLARLQLERLVHPWGQLT